jgi:1-acyl-sn-glycerol-3-phosphate acyltransferase
MHLRVRIVPVAIDGLYDIWPRGLPLKWSAFVPFVGERVKIYFGPPLAPPEDTQATENLYERHTERLKQAVRRMWEEMRKERGTNPD